MKDTLIFDDIVLGTVISTYRHILCKFRGISTTRTYERREMIKKDRWTRKGMNKIREFENVAAVQGRWRTKEKEQQQIRDIELRWFKYKVHVR